MVRILGSLLCCFLLATPAWAVDRYYIGSSDGIDVLQRAQAHAVVLGHIPRLTDVKIIQKKRAWWKVRTVGYTTPEISGWVPSGAVRKRYRATVAEKTSNSFFSGLSSLFHRNTAGGQKTAVLGVRGLDEEGNAAGGKANMVAVEWMEGLGVSNADVAAFVEQGRLNP